VLARLFSNNCINAPSAGDIHSDAGVAKALKNVEYVTSLHSSHLLGHHPLGTVQAYLTVEKSGGDG
jgi:hypothetical protein